MNEITLVAALMTGLLGSVHCIGMCGGIVGALTMQLRPEIHQKPLKLLPYLLFYNTGRLFSYALAGVLMGWLGQQFKNSLPQPHLIGMFISGLFMILLGLYLANWWSGLTRIERLGQHIWKRLEPIGRHFLPVHHPLQALGLGAIWGWLPCGLVYTALVMALAVADPMQGGLLMLAFGVGTLPMLLSMGGAASQLQRLIRRPRLRQVIGSLIILLGVYSLLGPWHHTHHSLQIPGMCSTTPQ